MEHWNVCRRRHHDIRGNWSHWNHHRRGIRTDTTVLARSFLVSRKRSWRNRNGKRDIAGGGNYIPPERRLLGNSGGGSVPLKPDADYQPPKLGSIGAGLGLAAVV